MQQDIIDQLHKWRESLNSKEILCFENLPSIDLYMDQVVSIIEKLLSPYFNDTTKLITPSIINNYVKLNIIPPPTKKKYSKEHIAKLIIICVLKQVLSISSIKILMESHLKSMLISEFFNLFCKDLHETICATIGIRQIDSVTSPEKQINKMLLELSIKAGSNKLAADKILTAYDRKAKQKK